MQDLKVVLFDLGNVLVDLGDKARFANIFDVEARDETQLWEMWLKSPAVKAFDAGQISLSTFMEALQQETCVEKSLADLTQDFINWPVGLFNGAAELVHQLPPHIHRAVLSNTNDAHWGRLLDEMGLSGLFHSYFASHQVGLVKPDLAVYEYVVKALSVAPDQILFIDDNAINVTTARKVGMQAEQAKGIECAKEILLTYGVLK